jgi:hypothetical protein
MLLKTLLVSFFCCHKVCLNSLYFAFQFASDVSHEALLVCVSVHWIKNIVFHDSPHLREEALSLPERRLDF